MSRRRRKLVSDWPKYLLKNIPEPERRCLSGTAAAQNISVSDVVRSVLCERYRLVCPPESYSYASARDTCATTLLLRLQPRLAQRIEREAARTGKTKRRIILETITSHYRKEGTLA